MFLRHSFAALAALIFASPALPADPRPAGRPPAEELAKAPAASSAAASDLNELSLSGYAGGEFSEFHFWSVRADASLSVTELSPTVTLHGVASLGLSQGYRSFQFGHAHLTMFTLVPAARAQLKVTPGFELYGDLGLGLYKGFSSSFVSTPGHPPLIPSQQVTTQDTSLGVMMRLAAGGLYQVTPWLKLAAELGINPYFGDASTTTFVLLAGAQFNL